MQDPALQPQPSNDKIFRFSSFVSQGIGYGASVMLAEQPSPKGQKQRQVHKVALGWERPPTAEILAVSWGNS